MVWAWGRRTHRSDSLRGFRISIGSPRTTSPDVMRTVRPLRHDAVAQQSRRPHENGAIESAHGHRMHTSLDGGALRRICGFPRSSGDSRTPQRPQPQAHRDRASGAQAASGKPHHRLERRALDQLEFLHATLAALRATDSRCSMLGHVEDGAEANLRRRSPLDRLARSSSRSGRDPGRCRMGPCWPTAELVLTEAQHEKTNPAKAGRAALLAATRRESLAVVAASSVWPGRCPSQDAQVAVLADRIDRAGAGSKKQSCSRRNPKQLRR